MTFITSYDQTKGDLSELHKITREAGAQEERARVLFEIGLALTEGYENSWVVQALEKLRTHIENPRSQEQMDALLLTSIRAIAVKRE